MNGFKTSRNCAVLGFVLAMAAPAASLAASHAGKGRSAVHPRGFHAEGYHGTDARRFGGAPAARFSSGDPGYPGYRGTFISGSVVGAMGFYDNGYYEDGAVAVVQDPGGDAIGYCKQTYKSYDRQSGTYLRYDGQRHPCP